MSEAVRHLVSEAALVHAPTLEEARELWAQLGASTEDAAPLRVRALLGEAECFGMVAKWNEGVERARTTIDLVRGEVLSGKVHRDPELAIALARCSQVGGEGSGDAQDLAIREVARTVEEISAALGERRTIQLLEAAVAASESFNGAGPTQPLEAKFVLTAGTARAAGARNKPDSPELARWAAATRPSSLAGWSCPELLP